MKYKNLLFSFVFYLSFFSNQIVFGQSTALLPASDTLPTANVLHEHPKSPRKFYQTQGFKVMAAPVALIGYGLATWGDNDFPVSSHDIYNGRQEAFPTFRTKIDDFTVFVPVAAVYGLNALGVQGKHHFVDRSALYILSSGVANGVSLFLKGTTNTIRPDGSNNHSFPSGHTTNAFVAAEFMHQEYKGQSPWYSIAGYTVATATGAIRILNNKHWFSDVAVGAGIGILSTKATYLLYPWVKQKLGLKTSEMAVAPLFNNGSFGFIMVLEVR